MDEQGFRHVGIVVPDLEAASARLTDLLGLEWDPVKSIALDGHDADGAPCRIELHLRLSTEGRVELIQEAPGTPWVCNEHSNLHHVAFFADDLVADSHRLSTGACPLAIADGRPGAPTRFAYHRDPLGILLEINAPAPPTA